ncbi:Lar-like restriction alleviation protein [Pantoea phage PdC23]|uniref:Restriction alleviation protein n=1 Tax=Pantoea phage PdC23 TaxID=2894356 RepID=A0AAE8YHK4_9CAUD|nr:Lar-like restriction alleviation protein [Pantoea phage PdC23]UGC97775.1 restriction alleviation protein [Pantoea phage PdC23]
MEIKPCPFCGGKIEVYQRGVAIVRYYAKCTLCSVQTEDNCMRCEDAADVVNQRHESSPSEADRWLKEATEQRARAELAEAQRDELAQALEAIKRGLVYGGVIQ